MKSINVRTKSKKTSKSSESESKENPEFDSQDKYIEDSYIPTTTILNTIYSILNDQKEDDEIETIKGHHLSDIINLTNTINSRINLPSPISPSDEDFKTKIKSMIDQARFLKNLLTPNQEIADRDLEKFMLEDLNLHYDNVKPQNKSILEKTTPH